MSDSGDVIKKTFANPKPVKDPDSMRRVRNHDLIQRMRQGDSLQQFNSELSWFPPRPIIDKDPKAMRKLYEKKAQEQGPNTVDGPTPHEQIPNDTDEAS